MFIRRKKLCSLLVAAALFVTSFLSGSQMYASAKSIMKVSSKKVYIEGIGTTTNVTVTFKSSYGYTKSVVKDKRICSSKWGQWDGDQAKLMLKGLRKGKTTVTVTNTRNRERITLKVYVVKKKPKLNAKSIQIKKNETYGLYVKDTKYKATYKSSNKAIAAVAKSGLVTGKKDGICTITATCNGKKYKCKVTVSGTLNTATPKVSPTATPSASPTVSPEVSAEPGSSPDAGVMPVPSAIPADPSTDGAVSGSGLEINIEYEAVVHN